MTLDKQVFLHGNPGFRIIGFGNVMHTVTVRTDGSVDLLPGELLFEQGCGGAVEIRHVGFEHVGGKPILAHDLFVIMAVGTKSRRVVAE